MFPQTLETRETIYLQSKPGTTVNRESGMPLARLRASKTTRRAENKQGLSTYPKGAQRVLRPVEILTIYLHCPPYRALSLRATGLKRIRLGSSA